jgi:hypothetical protein
MLPMVNGAKTPARQEAVNVANDTPSDHNDETLSAWDGAGLAMSPLPLPGAEQTPDTIERWVARTAAPEVIVVVRHVQRGLYEYHLDEVIDINRALRRVYLAQHGTFGFDGAGASGARGQLTLLEPTADVLDVAIKGRTWQHGQPAFKRPLSALEWHLVASLGRSR